MKKCKQIQASMIDYFNNLLDVKQRKEIDSHLSSCHDCKLEYKKYTLVMALAKKRKRQAPSKAFEKMTWAEMKNSKEVMKPERVGFWKKIDIDGLFKFQLPVPVLTAAAFLAIGLFIGWMVFSPSGGYESKTVTKSQLFDDVQDAAYQKRAERLIDKSKILIIGLANYNPSTQDISVLNLGRKKRLSEEYLEEAVFLNKNLNSSRQARLKRLVGDLEFILMQIASLENETDLESVEILKKGIDGRGILLKIDLEEIDRIERSSDKSDKLDKNTI